MRSGNLYAPPDPSGAPPAQQPCWTDPSFRAGRDHRDWRPDRPYQRIPPLHHHCVIIVGLHLARPVHPASDRTPEATEPTLQKDARYATAEDLYQAVVAADATLKGHFTAVHPSEANLTARGVTGSRTTRPTSTSTPIEPPCLMT